MDHRVVRSLLQAVPFRPFRMRLADGREFAVPHPDYLGFMGNDRVVTHTDPARDDALTLLEPLLIISIEYTALPGSPGASPG